MNAIVKSLVPAARTMTTRLAGDRKGVTALEYALIAAAVVLVVIAAYNTLFGNLAAFIGTIDFDGTN